MIPPPLPDNEHERLRWLRQLDILDTIEEQSYDDLTLLAAHICQVPIALVSLVDEHRQWFKSHHGLDARETPREHAFCAHAILDDRPFVVEDSEHDRRFHDNPLVTGPPHVKFYAGVPLVLRQNVRLGTLCVIDHQPRTISTEQLAALQALARQTVALMELRLTVREMDRLDRAKDEFISMISHELRTPLTSVKGALGLLAHDLDKIPDEASRQLVEVAHRNTDRLLALVNDILDVAKLEAGRFDLDRQVIDLAAVIEKSVELNRVYIEECGCRVEFRNQAGSTVRVRADEARLLQVLTNLISNATKFTVAGDTIEIDLERAAGIARVSVTDHGPGIEPEHRAQLFDRFYQAHNRGDGRLPGTGLGLKICKHLVELHGGSIGFRSEPGVETCFFFTLPLA